MGRKIPAKKHRGVKDPLIQQAKRLESLKGKINAPPKDPDDQPVPRSLIRLFGLEEQNDRKKNVRKKNKPHANHEHRRGKNESSGGIGNNSVSRLRKAPGESGRDFSLRISSAIKALHNPVDLLEYPQDLEAEDVKGQHMAGFRDWRAKKRKRDGKGGGDTGDTPEHLTRTQKQALKKKTKKMRAQEASDERREVTYERVSFGDVAHAPPALRPPRAPRSTPATPRPGRRDLLLSRMLGAGAAGVGAGVAGAGAGFAGDADLARRERARLEAVAAYRALKKTKHAAKNKY